MNYAEILSKLRRKMELCGIDMYIIPTSDFHLSEYVGEYFKTRQFITGFTGSAGTALVTQDKAILWTDGRYFIQAEAEIKASGFELYRMGMEGVPTVSKFVKDNMPEKGTLGFDGRVMSANDVKRFIDGRADIKLYTSEDLVDEFWNDRPSLACEPVWILKNQYSGKSVSDKLADISTEMKKSGADTHIVSSLYDIAWILNLRGNDIAHVPVFMAFLIITEKTCTLYTERRSLTTPVANYNNDGYTSLVDYLAENNIVLKGYNEVYQDVDLSEVAECEGCCNEKPEKVLLDKNIVNYRIVSLVEKYAEIIDKPDPSYFMKAVKNDTELQNTRIAHLKDGVAMTKFMYWLKTNDQPCTEFSVQTKLDEFRAEADTFIDLSFDNICAWGPNGAMMHYEADENRPVEIDGDNFLLIDSGGHYLEGSTDITRTFVIGNVTDEMKKFFTFVLIGNMNLSNAKFLEGCSGLNLDILARGPLWNLGLDYRCGTGHGVGHILNVHEGPNGFRWRRVPERVDDGKLSEGMITTIEPGVYLEGEYGIRTENELICKKAEKNEYGQFMEFETITYCPIDLDGIDISYMSQTDIDRLNQYHSMVYDKISPYLDENEKDWLKHITRAI